MRFAVYALSLGKLLPLTLEAQQPVAPSPQFGALSFPEPDDMAQIGLSADRCTFRRGSVFLYSLKRCVN